MGKNDCFSAFTVYSDIVPIDDIHSGFYLMVKRSINIYFSNRWSLSYIKNQVRRVFFLLKYIVVN
jgi:hypothetical protein